MGYKKNYKAGVVLWKWNWSSSFSGNDKYTGKYYMLIVEILSLNVSPVQRTFETFWSRYRRFPENYSVCNPETKTFKKHLYYKRTKLHVHISFEFENLLSETQLCFNFYNYTKFTIIFVSVSRNNSFFSLYFVPKIIFIPNFTIPTQIPFEIFFSKNFRARSKSPKYRKSLLRNTRPRAIPIPIFYLLNTLMIPNGEFYNTNRSLLL